MSKPYDPLEGYRAPTPEREPTPAEVQREINRTMADVIAHDKGRDVHQPSSVVPRKAEPELVRGTGWQDEIPITPVIRPGR